MHKVQERPLRTLPAIEDNAKTPDAKTVKQLQISFKCDELSERVTDEDSVTIASMALTKILVHPSKASHQLNNDAIDTYEMEDCVERLCATINSHQKFRVLGLLKPAQNEEGNKQRGFLIPCIVSTAYC